MSITQSSTLQLETIFEPSVGEKSSVYTLRLTNLSNERLSGFRLCVSGPGRIDPRGAIDQATMSKRLSNFTEFSPPDGFTLGRGEAWTISVHDMSRPLRHWTDGATSAYLVLDDERVISVAVAPTKSAVGEAPLKRGAEIPDVPATPPEPFSIIPWPARISISAERPAPAGFTLEADHPDALAAAESFRTLTGHLFPAEGIVRPAAEGGETVRLAIADGLADGGYEIKFSDDPTLVSASSFAGILYGLITLGQIWRGARLAPQAFRFPGEGTIADEPSMAWRGLHLDVARQFYGTAEIRKLLALMAWNKLNRFHWHLSDDEAWRIEIDAYPELTEIGAWRGHGLAVPPLLGSGPGRSGGYYTKAAVREIVACAGSFGIEIVPEIDVPGHCFAMQQALPELRDPDETGTYYSVQSFPNNCINPAREKTYEVIETIFSELIELFPFKTIHVGADEVPLGAWSGSPQALARLREISGDEVAEKHARRLNVVTNTHGADDIQGSGAALLQAEFLKRIQKFLADRGCITGGWEEAAHGDVIDKDKTYLCGWRNVEICRELADQGYNMVVCPGQAYYFDMAMSSDWDEPGASWAGWSALEDVYAFDPIAGWSEKQKEKLLGIQACIWSESMTDRSVFDRLVFPRLSALAESAWTQPSRKSWPRFESSAGLMPVLYGRPKR